MSDIKLRIYQAKRYDQSSILDLYTNEETCLAEHRHARHRKGRYNCCSCHFCSPSCVCGYWLEGWINFRWTAQASVSFLYKGILCLEAPGICSAFRGSLTVNMTSSQNGTLTTLGQEIISQSASRYFPFILLEVRSFYWSIHQFRLRICHTSRCVWSISFLVAFSGLIFNGSFGHFWLLLDTSVGSFRNLDRKS